MGDFIFQLYTPRLLSGIPFVLLMIGPRFPVSLGIWIFPVFLILATLFWAFVSLFSRWLISSLCFFLQRWLFHSILFPSSILARVEALFCFVLRTLPLFLCLHYILFFPLHPSSLEERPHGRSSSSAIGYFAFPAGILSNLRRTQGEC